MLAGVLAERRLIELVVSELAHLLGVHIHDEESLMVGGQPHPVAVIHEHIPRQEVLGQPSNAFRCHETIDRIIPLFLLLTVDIVGIGRLDPVVAFVIDHEIIGIVLAATMLTDIVIAPHHLATLTIDGYQSAIAGGGNQKVVILGKRGDPELRG